MSEPTQGAGARTIFETLDGVRGVAAVAVVIFHAPALFAPLALPGAYLAVDLFFALSGFVIDHAYGERLASGMGVGAFMRARLIRLYPVYLLGLLLGAAKGAAAWLSGGGSLDPAGLATAGILGLVVLPSPTVAQAPQLFPLNSPAWSLFFELVANLIFVACWRFLTLKRIIGAAALAGLVLAALTWSRGGMGLGDTWGTLPFGFLRAMASFLAGVALHRLFVASRGQQRASAAAWLFPIVLIPAFCVAPQGAWRIAYDLGFIAIASPICIWIGAHLAPKGRLAKVYGFLGGVSYVIYIIHYPLVTLAQHVTNNRLEYLAPWVGLLVIAGLLIAGALIDRLYDQPVRRSLARRWRTSARPA